MKFFRRTLSLLLAAVMLLTVLPLTGAKLEASAKEVVPGSFNAAANYIMQKGYYNDYCGYQIDLEENYSADGYEVVSLSYAPITGRVSLMIVEEGRNVLFEFWCGVVKGKSHAEMVYYIGDISVWTTFEPESFSQEKIDYTLFDVVGNVTEAQKAEIEKEANELAWESFNYLNNYLVKNLGFGLANFGFTVFGDPVPLKETKVQNVKMNGFSVKYKDVTAAVPEIAADGYNYTVKFESSNPKVISINDNGEIETLRKGSSVITCTVTDSFGNVTTQSSEVKVTLSFGQWLIWIFLLGFLWY